MIFFSFFFLYRLDKDSFFYHIEGQEFEANQIHLKLSYGIILSLLLNPDNK